MEFAVSVFFNRQNKSYKTMNQLLLEINNVSIERIQSFCNHMDNWYIGDVGYSEEEISEIDEIEHKRSVSLSNDGSWYYINSYSGMQYVDYLYPLEHGFIYINTHENDIES